jgi:two-component system sensor histidine kinase HydH
MWAITSEVLMSSAEWLRRLVERRYPRWPRWVANGAGAMAVLSALSLAVTVGLAQRALETAADVVVRGDGDTLIADIVVDLWETESLLTSEALAAVIAKHERQGLRYVALVDRQDHHAIAEAGGATLARPLYQPGAVVRDGRRVRLVALIPPRSETRAASGAAAALAGPALLAPYPRPYLVVELEPPLIKRLQDDLLRIAAVAAMAALVLVGFAWALSRTTARLEAVQARAERERRLVALGRASSVIAHELRNPLAALKGHAQLLLEDLAEPARTKAMRVVEGAERIEHLTTVLLDFVRDGPLDVRATTPAELTERALLGLPADRVRVDLTHAPEVLSVDAERAALALRNLVENAVQATPADGGKVEVRFERDRQEVVIEVRDHGSGLAEGQDGQIFEPFVTTKIRGTGLGLSIVRRIAEQHRGRLTAETHCQGGAVFRLVLPLTAKPAGT